MIDCSAVSLTKAGLILFLCNLFRDAASIYYQAALKFSVNEEWEIRKYFEGSRQWPKRGENSESGFENWSKQKKSHVE
jgi:hypothetical protein